MTLMPKRVATVLFFFTLSYAIGESALTKTLVREVCDLPDWRSDRVFTKEEWKQYFKTATNFAEADSVTRIEVLRQALGNLDSRPFDGYSEGGGKLFILLRLFFDVDRRQAKLALKGFVNSPTDDLLWPIRIDESGGVDLANSYAGSRGPAYHPEEEYRIFEKTFRLRDLNKLHIVPADGELSRITLRPTMAMPPVEFELPREAVGALVRFDVKNETQLQTLVDADVRVNAKLVNRGSREVRIGQITSEGKRSFSGLASGSDKVVFAGAIADEVVSGRAGSGFLIEGENVNVTIVIQFSNLRSFKQEAELTLRSGPPN